MKYKILPIILCIFLFAFSLSYSQLPACYHCGVCSAYCLAGGDSPCDCYLGMHFNRCSTAGEGSFTKKCLNERGRSDCECGCGEGARGFAGTISYYDTVIERYFIETYECRGCATPTPTPTPTPPPGGGCRSGLNIKGEKYDENDPSDICSPCDPDPAEVFMCQQNGGTYDWASCQCGQSPIVIDVLGNGFNLTNAASGVQFDINGDGSKEQIAWSAANSDDAWLALDRNGNDLIDSGKELFGNSTQQPAPPAGEVKNGFLALAVFDKAANGGNDDGKINQQDAVFVSLRLWQDTNHNGISDASELKPLSELGLAKIDLDYQESRRTDEHGNRFRFKARVRDSRNAQLGRWAWDVYLVVAPSY